VSEHILTHFQATGDIGRKYLIHHSVGSGKTLSFGLVDRSPVHPREVFADALTDRASGIIVAHNHPAGSLEPSASDEDVTRQLKQAGEIMGIHLLDHIIFNRVTYFSFLESGRV
jgi:DNA repair protein RadC